MTVADLQKYLRGLADALAAAKATTAVNDLNDTAARLEPFARLTVADLARFLSLAWEYKTTGKVPELPSKPAGGGSGRKSGPSKTGPTDPAVVIERIKVLYDRALDPAVTREAVENEFATFDTLTKPQLDAVAAGCGFQQKFKNKPAVIKALVNHVMGRKGSYERAHA